MHKQAINHKQAIIGGGYLFTENACYICLSIAQQEVTSSAGLQKAGSLENLLDSALETKPVLAKAADREPAPMVAMEPPPLEEESGEEQGPEGKDRTK